MHLTDALTARVRERPASGPVVVEVDPEGVWIMQDMIGAVYGAGGTLDEARAEFEAALDDHLHYLRAHRDELDERLQRQLPVLERLFPGH
jgi:hypothetical protein